MVGNFGRLFLISPYLSEPIPARNGRKDVWWMGQRQRVLTMEFNLNFLVSVRGRRIGRLIRNDKEE